MKRARFATLAAVLCVCIHATAFNAHAQAPDSAAARAALWRAARNAQQMDAKANRALAGNQTLESAAKARPAVDERDKAMAELRARLDTVVMGTPWGGRELTALRKAYPAVGIFVYYEAMLADRDGRDTDALVLYDRVLGLDPRDAETHLKQAALLDRMHRTAEARIAYARTLEMEPGNDVAFRALVRLQESAGTLPDLLDRVQRLQLRFPQSRTMAEHNIELLHRLGRTAEAEAAARALKERGK